MRPTCLAGDNSVIIEQRLCLQGDGVRGAEQCRHTFFSKVGKSNTGLELVWVLRDDQVKLHINKLHLLQFLVMLKRGRVKNVTWELLLLFGCLVQK